MLLYVCNYITHYERVIINVITDSEMQGILRILENVSWILKYNLFIFMCIVIIIYIDIAI